jgi:hypothetical protein
MSGLTFAEEDAKWIKTGMAKKGEFMRRWLLIWIMNLLFPVSDFQSFSTVSTK